MPNLSSAALAKVKSQVHSSKGHASGSLLQGANILLTEFILSEPFDCPLIIWNVCVSNLPITDPSFSSL